MTRPWRPLAIVHHALHPELREGLLLLRSREITVPLNRRSLLRCAELLGPIIPMDDWRASWDSWATDVLHGNRDPDYAADAGTLAEMYQDDACSAMADAVWWWYYPHDPGTSAWDQGDHEDWAIAMARIARRDR